MKLYTTVLAESKGFEPNHHDYFIFPDALNEESVKELLGSLRTQTWGYWERLPRKVVGVEPFDITKKHMLPAELKYITTQNNTEGEQIFIFSGTVNHDCMHEIIINLEPSVASKSDYRRVIGAGFTDYSSCYGHSETLGKDSRPVTDTALLVF